MPTITDTLTTTLVRINHTPNGPRCAPLLTTLEEAVDITANFAAAGIPVRLTVTIQRIQS